MILLNALSYLFILLLLLLSLTSTITAVAIAGTAQPYSCGMCSDMYAKPANMVLGVCTNAHPTVTHVKFMACNNQWCGVCMVFKERDCQGDVLVTPEKGQGFKDAKGGKSYYCI